MSRLCRVRVHRVHKKSKQCVQAIAVFKDKWISISRSLIVVADVVGET